MNVTAVFETWHLGDGNYPPLHKGMLVNLSFELEPEAMNADETNGSPGFRHVGDANYEFSGAVIREYKEPGDLDRLIVLDCAGFKFYISGCWSQSFREGQNVRGVGTLVLDHYQWVEFLDQYADPPDLFFTFQVERIWSNQIPERYINRTENALSYPTRLSHPELPSVEVEDMTRSSEISYYVVEFSENGIDPNGSVPRTFLG